ncbi:MAG: hypothetical protein IJU04_07305 [Ruminococcus sp.]|nr:hypothetical protein [Ruminococcus sp.]
MLYTIIDIYEVMRTDEIYPKVCDNKRSDIESDNTICTDPYKFLHII